MLVSLNVVVHRQIAVSVRLLGVFNHILTLFQVNLLLPLLLVFLLLLQLFYLLPQFLLGNLRFLLLG